MKNLSLVFVVLVAVMVMGFGVMVFAPVQEVKAAFDDCRSEANGIYMAGTCDGWSAAHLYPISSSVEASHNGHHSYVSVNCYSTPAWIIKQTTFPEEMPYARIMTGSFETIIEANPGGVFINPDYESACSPWGTSD